MIEVYSSNQTIPAGSSVTWDNIKVNKGSSSVLSAPVTVDLNLKGIYEVKVYALSSATVDLQLFVNGEADEVAQSSGTALAFGTTVTVDENNCPNICYTKPVKLQVRNTGESDADIVVVNMIVTKLC